MHKTSAEAVALVRELRRRLNTQVEIAVAPPFTALSKVKEALMGSPIQLFAQNCHYEKQGASERRQYFGESDEGVNKKIKAALEAGLHPIVCVGETLQEREANHTWEVVSGQLRGALAGLAPVQIGKLTLAYEPVWAIGTGKTATTGQAQEVHGQIRGFLREMAGPHTAEAVRIQYGGSVKPDNAAELLGQPDIDGALVGGASLKVDDFARIVAGAKP